VRLDALRAIEHRDTSKLEELARLDADALAGLHTRMLDADLLLPAIAYRTADPAARDRVIERILRFDGQTPDRQSPDTLSLNHLLVALAWIGDADVQRVFAQWRKAPPTWATALYIPAHEYTTTAGWTLDTGTTRRNLYLSGGRTLVRTEQASSAVRVLDPRAGHCQLCSNPLGTLLQLDLSARPRVHRNERHARDPFLSSVLSVWGDHVQNRS
jgi:hypothetical protein